MERILDLLENNDPKAFESAYEEYRKKYNITEPVGAMPKSQVPTLRR